MSQKSRSELGHAHASGSGPSPAKAAFDNAVSTTKDELQDAAHDLSTEVTHTASELAGRAKKAAESKFDAGKDFATDHLDTLADALRKTSKELRSTRSMATDYIDKAANSVDRVSRYFQTRTLSELAGDVENYARREPAVFLGGAFFMGMLGGRFLKAAAPGSRQNGSGASERASSVSERSSRSGRSLPGREGHRHDPTTSWSKDAGASKSEDPKSNGGPRSDRASNDERASKKEASNGDGANRAERGSGAGR